MVEDKIDEEDCCPKDEVQGVIGAGETRASTANVSKYMLQVIKLLPDRAKPSNI